MTAEGPSRTSVDGEEFEVGQPDDSRALPLHMAERARPRYGFGPRTHPSTEADRSQLDEAVRDFLSQTDPATGHIE